MNDRDDLHDLISQVSTRLGSATPIELLRIEVKFLTVTLQGLLGQITPFSEARDEFFRVELAALLEALGKPKLHIATTMQEP